jgi:hypothetical protein
VCPTRHQDWTDLSSFLSLVHTLFLSNYLGDCLPEVPHSFVDPRHSFFSVIFQVGDPNASLPTLLLFDLRTTANAPRRLTAAVVPYVTGKSCNPQFSSRPSPEYSFPLIRLVPTLPGKFRIHWLPVLSTTFRPNRDR